MVTASASYPYFDPADFAWAASPPPSTVSPASSMSSVASQRWVDAHSSPYSSCAGLAAQASSSQSSIWTASSVSEDEQRCLDLLDQLEDEVCKLGGRAAEVEPAQGREQATENRRVVDVFGEAVPVARPSTFRPRPRAVAASPSVATLRPSSRRSRRLSFTKTDLADLDIDAILDAYTHDGALPPIETPAAPSRPPRSQLRAAKSAVSLRQIRTDIFPSGRSYPCPPPVTAQNLELHRTTTSQSARSAHSVASASSTKTSATTPYDDLFPHRRVAPFPTLQRKQSAVSVASTRRTARRPSAADAPPLPPLPTLPFVTAAHTSPSARSNRTFSSFARQSTCSNGSSLVSFPSSPTPSTRAPSSQAMRATLSRDSHYSTTSSSAASSSGNSFRWSVATSSTAPSDYGASADGCSRRGSVTQVPPLPSAYALSSPSTRGKARFAASAPREDDEDAEEQEADLPASRRRGGKGSIPLLAAAAAPVNDGDDSDAGRDHGGLISWEDFASELEALPPPPAAAQLRRAGAMKGAADAQAFPPPTASIRSGREGRAHRMRKISLATLRVR